MREVQWSRRWRPDHDIDFFVDKIQENSIVTIRCLLTKTIAHKGDILENELLMKRPFSRYSNRSGFDGKIVLSQQLLANSFHFQKIRNSIPRKTQIDL